MAARCNEGPALLAARSMDEKHSVIVYKQAAATSSKPPPLHSPPKQWPHSRNPAETLLTMCNDVA